MNKRIERWLKGEETFFDKVIDKLIDVGLFTLIITYYSAIVVAIIGFWAMIYYIIKLALI